MKAGQNLKTITQILGRHKSTVVREVLRNSGLRGYRSRLAEILSQQRAQASPIARQIDPVTRKLATERLNLKWSPEQIPASLQVSYETIYQFVCANKARGGVLWKQLRCQKKKRKRYVSGRDRRGQIILDDPLPNVLLLLKYAVRLVTVREILCGCWPKKSDRDARVAQKPVCYPLARHPKDIRPSQQSHPYAPRP